MIFDTKRHSTFQDIPLLCILSYSSILLILPSIILFNYSRYISQLAHSPILAKVADSNSKMISLQRKICSQSFHDVQITSVEIFRKEKFWFKLCALVDTTVKLFWDVYHHFEMSQQKLKRLYRSFLNCRNGKMLSIHFTHNFYYL